MSTRSVSAEHLPAAGFMARQIARRILWGYVVTTIILSAALAWLLYAKGAEGFYIFQESGPGSTVWVNFIVCCLAWAILGLLICVCRWPVLARDHLLFTIVLTVVAFHFLNVVREPHQVGFGDARVYYSAAVNMQRGEPIAQRAEGPYLYPPLLAAALTPLVRLGPDGFVKIFHLLNFPAVILLAVLLYLALQRFRFSRELAALVVFVLLVVNVPLSRTLIYNQVNIYVFNLMLVSVLCFERAAWLSALALGLAAQLKVFPVVLLLPFAYTRQWKWWAWLIAMNALIVLAISIGFGFSYYPAFVKQLGEIENGTALRSAAVDSFLYNTFRLWGQSVAPPWMILGLRALLGVLVLLALLRLWNRRVFADAPQTELVILNSYVVLPVFMLVVAPLVWEHHFVLWMLTVPVLASSLKNPREWWLLLPAYVFLFLMPVYDIYPFSYLRLLGMILVIVLLHVLARRHNDEPPEFLDKLNRATRHLPSSLVTP